MTEYPIGRQVANMNERDISKMTESQLGKVNWDTDAFEKFTGFEIACTTAKGSFTWMMSKPF